MANYLLRLSFIGTNYYGWQIQPELPTVQGEVKKALERILRTEVKLTGCCRTDRGVHAEDYVANFLTGKEIDEVKVTLGLNSLLPKDIGIKGITKVPEEFNARFSVREKVYLYRIYNSPLRDPFLFPFCWNITRELDLERMRECAITLSGYKDYSSSAKLEGGKDTKIELDIDVHREDSLILIRFRAKRFLRHMVRRLTYAIALCGLGKLKPEDLQKHLQGENFPFKAPAKGLTLEKVITDLR